MSRSRNSIPSYLLHSQSGRARAVWTDPAGTRRFRLLPGTYDSKESRAAYAKLLLELDAGPHHRPAADPDGFTVAEVLLAYLDHAERHYSTPDGKPTSEIYEVRVVIRASPIRNESAVRPEWDEVRRTLSFGGIVLKRYTGHSAKNQIAVLEAFEEAGWPASIRAPLRKDQILNTVRGLNKSIEKGSIEFHGDGSGDGISWNVRM